MSALHAIRGASVLSPLAPGREYRPALDEAYGLGFDLVRVFCGALPWCGQELSHVYDGLPRLLEECTARGLNAYLSYNTEAGTGYDLTAHVDRLEAIARAYPVVVLREVANEPYHDTQGGRLEPERCAELAARMSAPVGYGAAADDESTEYAGGAFAPVHLDRGRDPWNMVRRVREILALSETTGTPGFNQEPIGAGEVSEPGRREANPAIWYTMGALNRLFCHGSGVFHSQSGLDAQPLGPNQRTCAIAYLDGVDVWPGAHHLQYLNTGHQGSPVLSANFDRVVRVYSGIDGAEGYTIALGLAGSVEDAAIEWGNGYTPCAVLGEMPGVIVWHVRWDGSTTRDRKGPREGPR
jgi:hypothetical protein